MKTRKYFDDAKLDRAARNFWAGLNKSNPFKGMTTKEILTKIRED